MARCQIYDSLGFKARSRKHDGYWRRDRNWFPIRDSQAAANARLARFEYRMLAFHACIAYNECMQYTIRNVPHTLDDALRKAARERGKSLNEVAIEALARGAGVAGTLSRQRDLGDIAGTWRKDPAFDSALAGQDTIDQEMWR